MEIKASLFAIIIVILFNLLFPQFSKTPFFVAAIKKCQNWNFLPFHDDSLLLFIYVSLCCACECKKEKKKNKINTCKIKSV